VQGVHTRVIENSVKPAQEVYRNSVSSSEKSVPGGNTRTSFKRRRESCVGRHTIVVEHSEEDTIELLNMLRATQGVRGKSIFRLVF
jgi:hypothetical protein